MSIERSAERDAAVEAMLPNVPFDGWTTRALRAGGLESEAMALFPRGAVEIVEVFCDLADRQMSAGAAAIEETRLSRRVRAVVALRLAQNRGNKEAIRRALAVLSLPRNAGVAARCTARTVDAIWQAAGDQSDDLSWYTKRAILAGVYGATLLFWLRDASEDDADTLAFLDRRLAAVGRIGRVRGRVQSRAERIFKRVPGTGELRAGDANG
jgi:ubiquinone biosynthesis protein COQ9